jgi:hypothetical protein
MSSKQAGQFRQQEGPSNEGCSPKVAPIERPAGGGPQNPQNCYPANGRADSTEYLTLRWWFNSPQTFLMLVVAIISILSSYAAMRSANAAKRSADIAELALKQTERAYVAVSDQAVDSPDPPGAEQFRIRARIRLMNFGRSPGVIREIRVRFLSTDQPPPRPVYDQMEGRLYYGFLHGEQPFETEWQSGLFQAIGGDGHLLFYGVVRYDDIWGGGHCTGFGFIYQPGAQQLQRYGENAYNYIT